MNSDAVHGCVMAKGTVRSLGISAEKQTRYKTWPLSAS
jgi:hypothetical protein